MNPIIQTDDNTYGADPEMVRIIIQAMGEALDQVAIEDVTTEADILSAMFTILARMLKAMKAHEDPDNRTYNTQEIDRVLTMMLYEFGSPSILH